MRVLMFLDRGPAAAKFAIALEQLGHVVDRVQLLAEAHDALELESYDLLVADLDHAGEEALSLVRSARAGRPSLRLLVCGSRDTLALVKAAVDAGADEFLLRPFDVDELKIRIGNLAAFHAAPDPAADRLVVESGPLKVDMTSRLIWLDGEPVELTPRERGVLQVLFRHRGTVVSKEYIASRVFSMQNEATATSIETYVHRLRRKIGRTDVTIRTLRGLGYVLEIRSETSV